MKITVLFVIVFSLFISNSLATSDLPNNAVFVERKGTTVNGGFVMPEGGIVLVYGNELKRPMEYTAVYYDVDGKVLWSSDLAEDMINDDTYLQEEVNRRFELLRLIELEPKTIFSPFSDGALLVGYYGADDTQFDCPWVIRLDSNQQIQWQHEYPELIGCRILETLQVSDGFLVCGRYWPNNVFLHGMISKIDNNGKIVWQYKENRKESAFYDMISTPDNGAIVLWVPINGGFLECLSGEGSVVWERGPEQLTIPDIDNLRLDNIEPLKDGFVVLGRYRTNGQGIRRYVLLHFNSQGEMLGYLTLPNVKFVERMFLLSDPKGGTYIYGFLQNVPGEEDGQFFAKLNEDSFIKIDE